MASLDASGIESPYLFVYTEGALRGQRIKDFTRAWRTACRAAKVPGMLRHDFRHTAVRGLVNAGVPERVVMEITGHRTRSGFDRYHIVSQATCGRRVCSRRRRPRLFETGQDPSGRQAVSYLAGTRFQRRAAIDRCTRAARGRSSGISTSLSLSLFVLVHVSLLVLVHVSRCRSSGWRPTNPVRSRSGATGAGGPR